MRIRRQHELQARDSRSRHFGLGVKNVVAGAIAIHVKGGLVRGLMVPVESIRGLARPARSRKETARVASDSIDGDSFSLLAQLDSVSFSRVASTYGTWRALEPQKQDAEMRPAHSNWAPPAVRPGLRMTSTKKPRPAVEDRGPRQNVLGTSVASGKVGLESQKKEVPNDSEEIEFEWLFADSGRDSRGVPMHSARMVET